MQFGHLLRYLHAIESGPRIPSVDQVRIKTVLGLVQALTDNVDGSASTPPGSDIRAAAPSPRKSPAKIDVVKRNKFGI